MSKKMTTEEFIARARQKHGDKYDYSKTKYVNAKTKVCIICPEHGEFWQNPDSHIRGFGCVKCTRDQNLTTEEFIVRARAIHGDKYDYSKTKYVDAGTKVCIICPEHGEFWQTPNKHIKGHHGCPNCVKNKKMSTNDFIEKAISKHGDKYDYSKVVYENNRKPVCIICPTHGEFWQAPTVHLRGGGCPKCTQPNRNMTTEEFIAKAKLVHNDKYDYSKVEYKNITDKVCIICPEHGEFWQTPNDHLNGSNCPKCVGGVRYTKDEFVKLANEIHHNKYDYSKVEYHNSHTKVCIICPEHGEFWQTPNSHLSGAGCPKCVQPNSNMTTEEFIQIAKDVHKNKYDYSKVSYEGVDTKVCIICPEHGEFWQTPYNHLKGCGCPKCGTIRMADANRKDSETLISELKAIFGDRYDYSKIEYVNSSTKICLVCPEHGEWWALPGNLLKGHGCPNCTGLRKEYKFNLLEEFANEYEFKAFLANNDINILMVILRNLDKKYEPLKKDIERALANADTTNPMDALRDKYSKEGDDEETPMDDTHTDAIDNIDLDDDNAVNDVLKKENDTISKEDEKTPNIEDVIKNNEKEIQVINRIEHMLTPEDRQYIMDKFLGDKRRAWIAAREEKNNK